MSLESETSGIIFDIDSDQIYTGAGTFLLYTPPSGTRILLSDIVCSAQDNGVYLIKIGIDASTATIKRRMFIEDSGGWVENRRVPIKGAVDEKIYFQILTASASATISVSGEVL